MRKVFTIAVCATLLFPVISLKAQNTRQIELVWTKDKTVQFSETDSVSFPYFQGAIYNTPNPFLPFYSEKFNLAPRTSVNFKVSNIISEIFPGRALPGNYTPAEDFEFTFHSVPGRFSSVAEFMVIPFRKNSITGQIEKLVSFNIDVIEEKSTADMGFANRSKKKENSVLVTGNWYKVGVTSTGIYKIDYQMLKNLGMNVDQINPNLISIYGHGGGMLPKENAAHRIEDLKEMSIFVAGEENGQFNPGDYILFYAEGPHGWNHDQGENKYYHQTHYYSDTTFYFITITNEGGRRINIQNSYEHLSPNYVTGHYDLLLHHEKDTWNSIHKYIRSGKEWFGEEFDFVTSQQISLDARGRDLSFPVRIRTEVAARSPVASNFNFNMNGVTFSLACSPVGSGIIASYANTSVKDDWLSIPAENININITYNKPSSISKGFLNYVSLQTRGHLAYNNYPLIARDGSSVGPGKITRFNVANGNSAIIWDVTDFHNVKRQQVINNSFVMPTDELKTFIIFNEKDAIAPFARGRITNQNLRGLPNPDMIIVSHPSLIPAAERLANFHRTESKFLVHIVTPGQIYNEFSSGTQDVTAIRDFIRMFYENASTVEELPKYLVLFGDASYDYKNRIPNNTNMVPTFQSINSLLPTGSYATDDFFGFLDPHEGDLDKLMNQSSPTNVFDLDIRIGRFPVQNLQQAYNTVDKVIRYRSNESLGNWRNILAFIADDGDQNIHFKQTDDSIINNLLKNKYPSFNFDKIYFDAYPKRSTPSGQRYPDVNEAINRRVNTGALIVNYIGHGGELGWAHERVLEISDIHSWKNHDKLPVFVTATCEFSRFDDPLYTSAGELTFIKPDGGASALLTTTRLVWTGPNIQLGMNLYQRIFEPVNNKTPSLGDVFMRTKNNTPLIINNLSFTYLGDPAMIMAIPLEKVETVEINEKPVTSEADTLKALSLVTVKGRVVNRNGQHITGFNGIIHPTVYDIKTTKNLLGNDPDARIDTFEVQNNILYKGKASVTAGEFSFQFIVPKDISYKYDYGKISYYAENGVYDANGYYNNIIIGGTSDSMITDNEGPEIKLFINDEGFNFGGLTHENPLLIAKLWDESGINTAGNGIGHELTAILNEGKPIVLNDYYEAGLDNYREGEINYPFYSLEDGRYSLRVKVWDVANNSSEAYTEFVVASSSEVAISHVLNYPNPFTTNTTFMFDHNRPGEQLDVKIQVFTIGGKLVKTIDHISISEGNNVSGIAWDGKDEFGSNIGRGVYIYKLTVRTPSGNTADKIEKLVILK